jgi:hypothetical protein
VTDAKGATDAKRAPAFRYAYDLANRPLSVDSIDAGTRRVVLDAAGNELERRDGKGALVLRAFDVLNRPLSLWARDNAGESVTLRERVVYGDALDPASARAANLLGRPHEH